MVSTASLEQTALYESFAFAAKSVTHLDNPNLFFEARKKIRNSPNQPFESVEKRTEQQTFLHGPLSISDRAETFPKDANDVYNHHGWREAPTSGAKRPKMTDSYPGV